MNKRLLLLLLFLTVISTKSTYAMKIPPVGDTNCYYTFTLQDSYGDGWNGAYIRVTNMTTGGYTDITVSSGYMATHTITFVEGHRYSLSWNSGNYDMECSFSLSDNLGSLIYEYEPDFDPYWGYYTPPTGTFFSFTALCTDQMCVSPTNLRMVSHTPYTATLRWAMSDTGIHEYKLYYGTSSNPDSMMSVIANDSTYTLTGLSPDSTYHVRLYAMCNTDVFSRWPLLLDVFTGYCEPRCYGWYGDNLRKLSFGNGAEMMVDTVVTYTYEDRHNRVGGVIAGDTLNISMTFEYEIPCAYIWVDWNNNYQFENNELIVSNNNYDYYSGGTRNYSYVVPSACPSGDYRMRCFTLWSGSSVIDPCSEAMDARDYTLHVISSSDTIRHIYFDTMQYGTIAINGNEFFSGGMSVVYGSTITITAVPNQWCAFRYMIVNGDTVNSPYTMTVMSDVYISASFFANLPELHVTSLTCSDIVAGQNFNASWTIRNDGNIATPVGVTWVDRLYLSTVPYINTFTDEPLLLGTWENVSALDTGQSYTRTITTSLPLRHGSGQYYLFLLTDAANAYNIQWQGGTAPSSYNPPPFVLSTGRAWNNSVVEISESDSYHTTYDYYSTQEYQHDNFNMKTVQVTIPPLADLEVTNIIRPTNFYSGTQVNVTATITNTGEAPTLSSGWRDVLYISTSPTFSSSALQLASVWHSASNALAPDSSYQVTFTGYVPLSWYGEAYFYVTTDPDDNEYEHIANDNNTSRSEIVNIYLTPPADLVVSNVTVPAVASNQLPISVSYTVNNDGLGAPDFNNWYDGVYLSTSPTLPTEELNSYGNGNNYNYSTIPDTIDWFYTLDQVPHSGGLPASSSYTINRNYTLPNFITDSGLFYIIVRTDAGNQVFEYLSENNNTTASRASAISFYFPDLRVDSIMVSDTIDNHNDFAISCIISNHGLGKAVASWQDRITISGTQLGFVQHTTDLMPGESYTATGTYSMPTSFTNSTQRTITVTTDYYNNVDEKSAEGNNTCSATTYTTIFKPDFYLSNILLPDTIVTGHTLDLQFSLNNGGQKSYFGNLYYNVYYSLDSTPNIVNGFPTNATFLQSIQQTASVSVGGDQSVTQTVQFPNAIADSDYYLYIIVNPNGAVPEDSTQNNILRSGPHYICHRPLPDLVLFNVTLSDTLQAGQQATISFDVTNNGEVTEYRAADILSTPFFTSLTAGDTWCPVQFQISPFSFGTLTLAVGDTLHFVQTVLISPTVSDNVSFTLKVDANNSIQELSENNNSVTISRYVRPTPFDLVVQSINTTDSCTTGDTLTISYTVNFSGYDAFFQHANIDTSDATGYIGKQRWVDTSRMSNPLWRDKLYISYDRFVTFDDRLLGNADISLSELTDTSYTVSHTVVMPHAFSGNIYLIAVADSAARNIESSRANNTLAQAISVTLAPQPNLRITSLVVDDTVTQRQGCLVRYTVVNDGDGSTRASQWVDKFYCGGLLATNPHEGILMPGESYTDSVEVVIPTTLLGNYTFQATTDADNQVFEHDYENDNSMTRPIVVLQAPPCDLIVTQISAASVATVGSPLTVSWTVQNIGENAISGYIKDGIYLSHDTLFDNNDVLIGTFSYSAYLGVFGSIQRTANCTVQDVTAGDYYVLVRTNIMNAFNEVSFTNNAQSATSTTEVSLPTLVIGQAEQLTLSSGNRAFYRMEVGSEYAGQTLSITLSTEATNAFNGLYLAHETMPSSGRYDFGSSLPYAMQQQILISSMQQGTYYLMASASTTNRSPQSINLLAEIIDFEILHVNTSSGTNTGSVTTQVIGAKFDTIMDFRLTDANGYTPAQKVKFTNTTESYVTFNLTDLPAGTYNVEAELPGGIVTFKENAFVVEQGLPAELSTNIVAPSSVREGSITTINIEYGNNGATDLNVSGFLVVSPNGYHIALTPEGLAEGRDSLTFSTAEVGMDPDIIRPGYFATQTIYVNAHVFGTLSIYIYPIRRRYE